MRTPVLADSMRNPVRADSHSCGPPCGPRPCGPPSVRQDWTVRTLDPFEANLFYIPAFNYGFSSNGGKPHENMRRGVAFIKQWYPGAVPRPSH